MTGLLLHLSGPLQAWGAPSQFGVRATHRWPTRSGLTGLFAAALGRERSHPNGDLAALSYTIRVDRPGQREADYHTVGGGYPRDRTPPTADGKRRPADKGTIQTDRWYLTDAAFTVAVTGPTETLAACGQALRYPTFPPYLGRRSCPPDTPVLLHDQRADAIAALAHLPLHRSANRTQSRPEVTFVYDTPPEPNARPDAEVMDVPGPHRSFFRRPLWERHRALPHAPDGGLGTDWLNAVHTYLDRLETAR